MEANKNIKGYQQKQKIGQRAFGAVYLAQKDNKNYVMKIMPFLSNDQIEFYQKILNVLYNIKSEYVIRYYESFLEKFAGNNFLYIIMEYGGTTDLKKYIEQRDGSLIEENIIKDIIVQICLGLKEIHKNKLIHRDLTPDNIFMDNNNKIKIGDFGVSKILTTTQNYTKSKVGKHHYFAPEIEKGEKYNNKVDIYALGCIMYELFTLNEYYNVKNEKETINTDIYNPKWQNLIDLALQNDYNKRPTIDEIYNYIENEIKNEIICIYNKTDKFGINILHDYKDNYLENHYKESYNEVKSYINEENIEIYVNNNKIKFNYEYDSDEIGLIEIKFKFHKSLTSTAFMFNKCTSLKLIDLSSFYASNVTSMNRMFSYCESLEKINLSSFITKNVINMSDMFYFCSSLKSLDLSSFNTKNVTNMERMFTYCESLESLNLSSFNTNKVTNMNCMFSDCKSLILLDLSKFNTKNINDMSDLFSCCHSLKSINLSSFNTSNVTNMSNMFCECKSLKSLNLSSFNTNNVTDMSKIFYYCESLESINLTSFKTNKVSDMSAMFSFCSSLKSLELSSFNTKNVINMSDMFYFCLSLKSLDLSSFNTENVINMIRMFSKCKSLKLLNISKFTINNVKYMTDMFSDCISLKKDNIKIKKNEKKILVSKFNLI